MTEAQKSEITSYIQTNIGEFHSKRLSSFDSLKFDKILKRKNPYLFRAKGIDTAEELVSTIMDAHLSSQEETVFGDFLEGLAVFVCSMSYGGRKSAAEGIDLEFEKEGIEYIVSIKSGPNWGNSSQIKKMQSSFLQAKRVLNTNRRGVNVVAINGCCYGKCTNTDRGDYLKLCGQEFWGFISGDENLYAELIEPISFESNERNVEFQTAKKEIIDRFVVSFSEEYCVNGVINWDKILQINSGK